MKSFSSKNNNHILTSRKYSNMNIDKKCSFNQYYKNNLNPFNFEIGTDFFDFFNECEEDKYVPGKNFFDYKNKHM